MKEKKICSRCRALKPAGRPLPHCRGGNGPPSATRRLRGGGAVVDSKNIVCHVNSSACHVYVTSFYNYNFHQLLQATFSRPFSCTFSYINAYIHLWTHSDVYILHLHSSVDVQRSLQCYSYIFAVIFVYIFVQPRLHSSVAPSNVSILQLYSPVPVDVQRSLQCYSYIFVAIFVYIFVHPRLHSSVDARVCVAYILRFSGPSLALFSRWQRVHGYTSLIRPRFRSSLHSTPTFSEHFRDPGVYKYSTFYNYILRTFSYI